MHGTQAVCRQGTARGRGMGVRQGGIEGSEEGGEGVGRQYV